MRDEIYDRDYQAGRAELHAGIDRAVLRIGRFIATTFNAFHAIQWSAPWREPRRDPRRCPGTA